MLRGLLRKKSVIIKAQWSENGINKKLPQPAGHRNASLSLLNPSQVQGNIVLQVKQTHKVNTHDSDRLHKSQSNMIYSKLATVTIPKRVAKTVTHGS